MWAECTLRSPRCPHPSIPQALVPGNEHASFPSNPKSAVRESDPSTICWRREGIGSCPRFLNTPMETREGVLVLMMILWRLQIGLGRPYPRKRSKNQVMNKSHSTVQCQYCRHRILTKTSPVLVLFRKIFHPSGLLFRQACCAGMEGYRLLASLATLIRCRRG